MKVLHKSGRAAPFWSLDRSQLTPSQSIVVVELWPITGEERCGLLLSLLFPTISPRSRMLSFIFGVLDEAAHQQAVLAIGGSLIVAGVEL